MQQDIPIHLNQYALCKRWEVKKRTLERWRWTCFGPPYMKIGGRILYRLSDIVAYEETNTFNLSPEFLCARASVAQRGNTP